MLSTTLITLPLLVLLSISTLPLLIQPAAPASASAPSNNQQKRSPSQSSSSVANEPRLSLTIREGPPPQSSDGVLVSGTTLAAELVRAIAARGSGASGSGSGSGPAQGSSSSSSSSSSSVGWPAANSCAAGNVRWSAADERAREWRVLDRAVLEQRGALALANWPSVGELDRELVSLTYNLSSSTRTLTPHSIYFTLFVI